MCAKWVQKSMDFHVENRENALKKYLKKQALFNIFFSLFFCRFGLGFGRFWRGFETILPSKKKPKRAKFIFSIKLRFLLDLGRVGEGLGKVLGGFGDVQLALLG